MDTVRKKHSALKVIVKELRGEIKYLKNEKAESVDIEGIKELTRQESTSEIDELLRTCESKDSTIGFLEGKLTSLKDEFQEHRKKAQRLMIEKEMNLEKLRQRAYIEEEKVNDC